MYLVIFWAIIFSLSTAFSIVLLGDRNLISGNILQYKSFVHLIFHGKVILSLIFALISRFAFILMNNSLLKIERFADSSTTITAFISSFSFIFIVIINYIFLDERLNVQQLFAAALIMTGIWIMLK
jgi:drug/metabolite transporter (DMT)-like permease